MLIYHPITEAIILVWQDLRKLLIVLKGLINVPQGKLVKFVEIVEYQILNWPINFLGLPLGGKPQFIGSLRTRLALVFKGNLQ